MSQFVEVKTADLEGSALDWAVARVEGVAYNAKYLVHTKCDISGSIQSVTYTSNYRPSNDWAHGGPLRDKYKVAVYDSNQGDGFVTAFFDYQCGYMDTSCTDDDAIVAHTTLEAICLAIVVTKLGDVVQVPAELVGVKNDL